MKGWEYRREEKRRGRKLGRTQGLPLHPMESARSAVARAPKLLSTPSPLFLHINPTGSRVLLKKRKFISVSNDRPYANPYPTKAAFVFFSLAVKGWWWLLIKWMTFTIEQVSEI